MLEHKHMKLEFKYLKANLNELLLITVFVLQHFH